MRAPPNLYQLRFVFVLASSLFFIANYRVPRVIWWVRWMLMSFAQDLLFWEYEPDVYDYWNFSSLSMLSSPLLFFFFLSPPPSSLYLMSFLIIINLETVVSPEQSYWSCNVLYLPCNQFLVWKRECFYMESAEKGQDIFSVNILYLPQK